jgi:hypothetical protein
MNQHDLKKSHAPAVSKTGTLNNTFHRTSVRIRVPAGYTAQQWYRERDERAFLGRDATERAWARKVWRTLCGIEGCCCGTVRD